MQSLTLVTFHGCPLSKKPRKVPIRSKDQYANPKGMSDPRGGGPPPPLSFVVSRGIKNTQIHGHLLGQQCGLFEQRKELKVCYIFIGHAVGRDTNIIHATPTEVNTSYNINLPCLKNNIDQAMTLTREEHYVRRKHTRTHTPPPHPPRRKANPAKTQIEINPLWDHNKPKQLLKYTHRSTNKTRINERLYGSKEHGDQKTTHTNNTPTKYSNVKSY